MASKLKGDKKQHIQVFTRVRPVSCQEMKSSIIVDCPSSKEVSVRDKGQTKTFTFDRVFGPDSKQVDVYKSVVSPLIAEVLAGYNCTVFAYGQTGTGKTYTMVGDKMQETGKGWEEDPCCGIIPRTLSHLFDELKVRAEEYTVRVSFLELYNEELCDLLAPNENLRLYEDSMKKGSVIVSGLEERTVHNKDGVYAILETGNVRRQTATTLMNAQSSRSHTIFTITVHIKVTTPEGEDLIKTGKLNLVDLAGSENIGRSGAVDMRAREAGNINQSLLTLGRVITSLVERAPHVPYRESKLTRILQDSLGGRTKTSIIATISPAQCNLEETLSTLDYAHRARNITNKPEINQKTSKRQLIKEYTEEIERLRRDLIAAREKHGVYLASENYNSMVAEIENLNKELVNKIQCLKVREDEMAKQENILESLNMNLHSTQTTLAQTTVKLQEKERMCSEKQKKLEELTGQARALMQTAGEAITHTQLLHERLERSRMIHQHNLGLDKQLRSNLRNSLHDLKQTVQEQREQAVGRVAFEVENLNKTTMETATRQRHIDSMTAEFAACATNMVSAYHEGYMQQAQASQTFLSMLLEMLDSGRTKELMLLHRTIDEMSQQFKELREELGRNYQVMQEQSMSLQVVQSEMKQVVTHIKTLPQKVQEHVVQREEIRAMLTAEEENIRDKKLKLQADNEELGQSLMSLIATFMEKTQETKQLDEAQLQIENEKIECDNAFMEKVKVALSGSVSDALASATQSQQLGLQINTQADTVIERMRSCVMPMVDTMEEHQNKNMKTVEQDLVACFDEIELKRTLEERNIAEMATTARTHTTVLLDSVRNFEKEHSEEIKSGHIRSAEITEEIRTRLEGLVTEYDTSCGKLCGSVDQLTSKIDFFEERKKRDERTGSTPQRKDFILPKRLISEDNNKSRTSIESSDSVNSYDSFEFDDPAKDKENISLPSTKLKPLRSKNNKDE